MTDFGANRRRRRPKSGGRWPKWLRSPRLLRWVFIVGLLIFRLWRFLNWLMGPPDG